MVNERLVKYIEESRKRGYSDLQIKEPLLKNGWPIEEIELALNYLQPKYKLKNQVCVFLSADVLKELEKRAKKNMMTLSEQIEDILRRSCVGLKKKSLSYDEKLDDSLVALFSRKNCGRKKTE